MPFFNIIVYRYLFNYSDLVGIIGTKLFEASAQYRKGIL